MKSIKDYLHLYLGCEAAIGYDPNGIAGMRIDKIVDVGLHGAFTSNSDLEKFEDIKLILRPLSDMTEEEELEHENLFDNYYEQVWEVKVVQDAAAFKYLLSKGFDLFNLIPDGLAIDKTPKL